MSRLQCCMEWLDETEKTGYEAAVRGEPPIPPPNENDFRHLADFCSANGYRTRWMQGWIAGNKDSSHQPSP